jgi:signal transduction histidine kinase
MRTIDYFRDRFAFLAVNFVVFLALASILWLLQIGTAFIFTVFAIWFLPLLTYIAMEWMKNKRFYDELTASLGNLDQKFLLPEIIEKPEFIEGKMVYSLLQETSRAMHENVKKYRDLQDEYREYIETWVHEIKTPIASIHLIIDNHESQVTKNIKYETKKIEDYVEQVLYYSRSTDVSRDYIISDTSLKTVATKVIKKNARDFIQKKVSVDINAVEENVFSDSKWLEFILNQIVVNAVKYSPRDNGKVVISTRRQDHQVILTVEDNGVGIGEKDIDRVFDKGFTGENGRKFGQSTGIGLYLCKSLCDKMGIGLSLTSSVGEGTKVNLAFPKSSQ